MQIVTRAAAPNLIKRVFLQDSSSTTGAGLTGLTSASTGLAIAVMRELDAAATSYTVAGGTIEGITTIGVYAAPTATKIRFKEIDATLLPGWYELQIAQALAGTADASRSLIGMLRGATNLAPCPFEILLTAADLQDAVALGLSRIDAAISSRSVYAGADTAGTTTLLARVPGVVPVAADYTAARAAKLDNLSGDAFARLGAPIGASISADLASVQADTDNLQTRVPAALSANGNMKSDVKEVNDIIVTGVGTPVNPWGP